MVSTRNGALRVSWIALCLVTLLAGGAGVLMAQQAEDHSRAELEMSVQPADQIPGFVVDVAADTIPMLKVIEGVPSKDLLEPEPLDVDLEARVAGILDGSIPVKTTTAKVDGLYAKWADAYAKAGGDRKVPLVLGAMRGLMQATEVKAKARVDLIGATLQVTFEDLREGLDVWLVDNQSGPGMSMIPEAGDRFFKVGSVRPRGTTAALDASFEKGFFERFELDLLVATPAGVHPKEEMRLFATPSTFQRRFTRERLGRPVTQAPVKSHVDPRVALGLVSQQVLDGADLFFRGTFEGNGRSCGTCHPPAFNLVIDPAFVARQRQANPDDPLFIADPDRPDTVPLEIPDLLERFAIIFENVDGFEDPGNKFMMRSVPHNISSGTAFLPATDNNGDGLPDDGTTTDVFAVRTGWSGDGAPSPGGLREFPVGAVIQHYSRDFDVRVPSPGSFRLQTEAELDQMEAFLLSTGRLNELDLSTVTLTDPGAESGRQLFTAGPGGGKCFACHNNAGGNSAFGGNRNFNTGIETVRIAELNARGLPCDGGFGGQGDFPPNDVGCAPGSSGGRGDGTFNTMPLVEAADTGPFFHTNAFQTIEEAVNFYNTAAFRDSPGGALIMGAFGEPIDLNDQQTRDVAAFLRVINSSFNVQQSTQRISAAQQIGGAFGLSERRLTNNLLILANNELVDAFFNLRDRGLNGSSQSDLLASIQSIRRVLGSTNPSTRAFFAERARLFAERADRRLGSSVEFDIAEGNLTF